jgi:hypothetical protein
VSSGGHPIFGARAASFGTGGASRWIKLSDIRPLLLRSAGIVGIAGTIMMVVSSGAWMPEPRGALRTSVVPTIVEEQAVQAALVPNDVGAALLSEPEPPPELASDEQADTLPAAAEEKAAASPDVETAAAIAEGDADPAAVPAVEADSPNPLSDAPSATAAEETPIRVQTVLLPVEGEPDPIQVFTPPPDRATARVEEDAPIQVASLPAVEVVTAPENIQDILAVTESEEPADPLVWPEDAVECPRGWLGSDAGSGDPACPAITANLEETSPAAEELDRAVAEHAEEVAALMPRVPRARPEPPPQPVRQQARSTRRASASPDVSWPDAPPPNCGSKHAYWRFVDEARTQKEWYCK